MNAERHEVLAAVGQKREFLVLHRQGTSDGLGEILRLQVRAQSEEARPVVTEEVVQVGEREAEQIGIAELLSGEVGGEGRERWRCVPAHVEFLSGSVAGKPSVVLRPRRRCPCVAPTVLREVGQDGMRRYEAAGGILSDDAHLRAKHRTSHDFFVMQITLSIPVPPTARTLF